MPPAPRAVVNNPLRQNRREIVAPTAIRKPVPKKKSSSCPNKTCTTPNVQDGICHNCGTIVDDSNIVSEVTFGENSNGAATVQGSFVAADQGGARSMGGPGFAGRGGGEGSGREATVRDGKNLMVSMAAQLGGIGQNVVDQGGQIFKIAAMNNFIQGRRLDMVAAVCLYSACRKEQPCRVMLIDFADRVQVNVFKLGKTFKDLHDTITMSKDGIRPVLPEDLIYRFASKLEFGPMLDKVADDACRMVKRMSFDWMVMGRRPSGVCGACLILAARMNNFRRTVTEVVYVVKVTTHTIKKRLTEFKRTATSTLTVEEFLNEEWRESKPHDPPSFYEKTEEFLKTKKALKPKRKYIPEDERAELEAQGLLEDSPEPSNKRQKNGKGKAIDKSKKASPPVELRRDADGFAIPPKPIQIDDSASEDSQMDDVPLDDTPAGGMADNSEKAAAVEDFPIDPQLLGENVEIEEPTDERNYVEKAVGMEVGGTIGDLVDAFGDGPAQEDFDYEEARESSPSPSASGDYEPESRKGKKGPDNRPIAVSQAWADDEDEMVAEIEEMIGDPEMNKVAAGGEIPDSPFHKAAGTPGYRAKPAGPTPESTFDPNTTVHAVSFEQASVRAQAHVLAAQAKLPRKDVCMEVDIEEDEFADDPEVQNCLLDATAAAIKEKIWVNNNREWLRKQQLREYQRQMAENGPPKATRMRKKKPRIGEGQTSAASTPGEAAVNVMKQRSFSKKINYDAIQAMFDQPGGNKSGLGSAATSRVTSQAGSALGSRASSIGPSEDGSEASSPASSASKISKKRKAPEPVTIEIDSDPDSEDDDYVNPSAPAKKSTAPILAEEPQVESWRSALANNDTSAAVEGDEDTFQEDENDYGFENGDLDDDAAFGDASVGGNDFEEEDDY